MFRYNSNNAYFGFNYEWKTCQILGCTLFNYTKFVDANKLRIQEFNYLKTFRNIDRTFVDKCISGYCDYYTIQNVFKNNASRFWNSFLCVKHNLGCPVKGGWSKWSSWSKCTATCGPGIKYRLRFCNRPKPSKISLNCSGSYIEYKNCSGKSCLSLNGTWCKWSNWSRCSVQQGSGVATRKRFCRNFNNSFLSSCLGPHIEISQCYAPHVNGGWSKWHKWSPCSAKCDKGTRYRMRSCTRPEPEGLGKNCTGKFVQTNFCFVEPCKGPPIMVATFNKQSYLKYAATEINMFLLHIIIRFYPFDMSGTLLRRFYDVCEDCTSVQLCLINCSLVLTVVLDSCNITLLGPSIINIGWNEVSFTITKTKITLQLNNDQISKYINCFTTSNFDQVMNIGEDFEGYIEKLYVNFKPYALTINNEFTDMYLPYAIFNTIFELSEEPLNIELFKTIKIPCPQLKKWRLELYLRFEPLARGNFISIKNKKTDYLLVEININIIKMKIKLDDYFNEVFIKFEEIDSSWIHMEIEQQKNSWFISVNGKKNTLIMPSDIPVELCKNYFYIGNFEENDKLTKVLETIGYLKLNENILNPNNFLSYLSSNEYNIFSLNLSDISYNEVTITSEEDVIELNCIVNTKQEYEDFRITWLKYDQFTLHKINCKMSNDCVITTNEGVSQITIFPNTILDDNFYFCTSINTQKIIYIYGVSTFENNNNNIHIRKFVFFGKIIITLTILFFLVIIKKIK